MLLYFIICEPMQENTSCLQVCSAMFHRNLIEMWGDSEGRAAERGQRGPFPPARDLGERCKLP